MATCASCGYLGIHPTTEEYTFDPDRPWETSTDKNAIEIASAAYRAHPEADVPICLVRALPITRMWEDDATSFAERRSILTAPNTCGQSVQWFQGLTPQEHLRMAWDKEAQARHDAFMRSDRIWQRIVGVTVAFTAIAQVCIAAYAIMR